MDKPNPSGGGNRGPVPLNYAAPIPFHRPSPWPAIGATMLTFVVAMVNLVGLVVTEGATAGVTVAITVPCYLLLIAAGLVGWRFALKLEPRGRPGLVRAQCCFAILGVWMFIGFLELVWLAKLMH